MCTLDELLWFPDLGKYLAGTPTLWLGSGKQPWPWEVEPALLGSGLLARDHPARLLEVCSADQCLLQNPPSRGIVGSPGGLHPGLDEEPVPAHWRPCGLIGASHGAAPRVLGTPLGFCRPSGGTQRLPCLGSAERGPRVTPQPGDASLGGSLGSSEGTSTGPGWTGRTGFCPGLPAV